MTSSSPTLLHPTTKEQEPTRPTLPKRRDQTFIRTSHLYQLFYERAAHLLSPHSLPCPISSNKWLRSGYGEKTRAYLASKTNPKLLLDFGGFPVFENASVDTCILMAQKTTPSGSLKAVSFKQDFQKGDGGIRNYAEQHAVPVDGLSGEAWFIGNLTEQAIRHKMQTIRTPLKEWNVKLTLALKRLPRSLRY